LGGGGKKGVERLHRCGRGMRGLGDFLLLWASKDGRVGGLAGWWMHQRETVDKKELRKLGRDGIRGRGARNVSCPQKGHKNVVAKCNIRG
jgi:hypothetical protein